MTWNYRVIKTIYNDEAHFAIHEVYYDEHGNISSYTGRAVSVSWGDDESGEEAIDRMKSALSKPFLDSEELETSWDKNSSDKNMLVSYTSKKLDIE